MAVLHKFREALGRRQLQRTGHHPLENLFQLGMSGVILLGMKAEVGDAMVARQLSQDVVAADLAAAVERHQSASLHPKNSHAIRRFLRASCKASFEATGKRSCRGKMFPVISYYKAFA